MAQILTLLILVFIPFAIVGTLLYYFGTASTVIVASILLIFPIVLKKRWYHWFYILYKTIPRDLKGAARLIRMQLILYRWHANNATVPKIFLEQAVRNPHRICYMHDTGTWTFAQVNTFSARIASYLHLHQVRHGDVVCLLMSGCPEYVCTWLGVSRLGGVVALINTSQRADTLLHSICTAKSIALIYSVEYAQAVEDIREKLPSGFKLFQFDVRLVDKDGEKQIETMDTNISDAGVELMSKGLKQVSVDDLPDYASIGVSVSEPLLYVYTSGTTGLPKAAVITHGRFCLITVAFRCLAALKKDDVLYCPLPLYHVSGGILGAAQPLLGGSSCVIKSKFSVSAFWKDCQKYRCTVAQYIGETCRYLLSAPPDPAEQNHQIHTFAGNGIQRDVWKAFQARFNIPKIVEFYGSTEGNANLVNFEGIPGVVGFLPKLAKYVYPLALVSCDPETGVPYRNTQGYCTNCPPGQPGLLLGKIGKAYYSRFSGYTDPTSTKKKILENVFKKGDRYFNSGDVLEIDELGYLYFRDRTGDTFRWKGENISTSEVEAALNNNGTREVGVYGVQVPGQEGRCGMAAIADPDGTLDLQSLNEAAKRSLQVPARPLFLRVTPSLPHTTTFKLRKVELRAEGFDLSKVGKDRLYFYDRRTDSFMPLTEDTYQAILQEKLRL